MKKINSIIILLCFTLPFSGSLIIYRIQKEKIRKEIQDRIKDGIKKEELVLLKFSSSDARTKLRWEHDREFEFQNQMYDVVKKEMHGDTIYYWCYWDQKESVLNAGIKEVVAKILGSHPQNKENQKRLITFLKTYYIPDHFVWKPDNSSEKQKYQCICLTDLSSGFHKPAIPPPKSS